VRYGDLFGEVWTTPALDGAAVWLPPARTTLTPWRMLRAGMFAVPLRLSWRVLGRLARIESIVASLHQQHAPSAHWYLSQLGVEPAHQGQGIGGALLRPMLSRLDAQGLACYLETMDPANVPFYQHQGFTVAAQVNVPEGGPSIWAMLRSSS
jgi:GNAT superfamily N-acetyltransferase